MRSAGDALKDESECEESASNTSVRKRVRGSTMAVKSKGDIRLIRSRIPNFDSLTKFHDF